MRKSQLEIGGRETVRRLLSAGRMQRQLRMTALALMNFPLNSTEK